MSVPKFYVQVSKSCLSHIILFFNQYQRIFDMQMLVIWIHSFLFWEFVYKMLS